MRKRIAINALTIVQAPSGGKTYLLNLIEALSKIAGDEYSYYVLAVKEVENIFREKCLKDNVNTRLVLLPSIFKKPVLRVLGEQLLLPIWLKLNRINLLFAARNVMPLLTSCPTVVGILSMHLNYEQFQLSWWRKFYGNLLLKLTAKKADAFVSISEYAGRTYIEKYSVDPDKLFVAPCGLSPEKVTELRDVPNLVNTEYLLFVSTLSPHKNIPFLIEVFAEVVDVYGAIKLVIVGRGNNESLLSQAKDLGIDENVIFTGAVSDTQLVQYYLNARMFVFPSLIEGFGLTPLEAMAHALPVLVSDKTSIPEVVGDAGIVLSPFDKSAWVKAILKVLRKPDYRLDLAARAKSRSETFTWAKAAETTLHSFRKVLENQP